MRFSMFAAVVTGLSMAGCASMTSGTSQTITVNTTPAGAECEFLRQGISIGSIASTPGSLVVRRSKHDITINCSKDGYEDASFYNNSGLAAAVGANIAVDVLLTAGLSSIIDSAQGADNEYESMVTLTLRPEKGTAQAQDAESKPSSDDVADAAEKAPEGAMKPIENP